MISELLGNTTQRPKLWSGLVILAVLGVAAAVGTLSGVVATWPLLMLLFAGFGALLLLQRPVLGLVIIIIATLIIPIVIGTGTAVGINPITLLIPALFILWLVDMARKRELRMAHSRTFLPLFLLLTAGVMSLFIGNATWDPFVPRPANFLQVQLAQLGIFFLAAAAYTLVANLVKDEIWLRYLVWTFLVVAGLLAVIDMLPVGRVIVSRISTAAFNRAPLWLMLTAVAGGQLLFNKSLVIWKRLFLALVLAAVAYYSLVTERDALSVLLGVAIVMAMLLWLRWPRIGWAVLGVALILLLSGVLFPILFEFGGGDTEWRASGISRIDLGRRVMEVTMRNPVTGLGPASYRVYASMEPLVWQGGRKIWVGAVISSHNNYIDLFSHVGLLGLTIFIWFMIEVAWLGLKLRKQFRGDFAAGYINGVLAALVGILTIMSLADWFIPFVYNIGYNGFQASVLVWIFFGGLVVFEKIAKGPS